MTPDAEKPGTGPPWEPESSPIDVPRPSGPERPAPGVPGSPDPEPVDVPEPAPARRSKRKEHKMAENGARSDDREPDIALERV